MTIENDKFRASEHTGPIRDAIDAADRASRAPAQEAVKVAQAIRSIIYTGPYHDRPTLALSTEEAASLIQSYGDAREAKGREDEREACAAAVEKRACELGRKECCGSGVSNGFDEPPECCGDPDFMISDREAAAAIRARKGGE